MADDHWEAEKQHVPNIKTVCCTSYMEASTWLLAGFWGERVCFQLQFSKILEDVFSLVARNRGGYRFLWPKQVFTKQKHLFPQVKVFCLEIENNSLNVFLVTSCKTAMLLKKLFLSSHISCTLQLFYTTKASFYQTKASVPRCSVWRPRILYF